MNVFAILLPKIAKPVVSQTFAFGMVLVTGAQIPITHKFLILTNGCGFGFGFGNCIGLVRFAFTLIGTFKHFLRRCPCLCLCPRLCLAPCPCLCLARGHHDHDLGLFNGNGPKTLLTSNMAGNVGALVAIRLELFFLVLVVFNTSDIYSLIATSVDRITPSGLVLQDFVFDENLLGNAKYLGHNGFYHID